MPARVTSSCRCCNKCARCGSPAQALARVAVHHPACCAAGLSASWSTLRQRQVVRVGDSERLPAIANCAPAKIIAQYMHGQGWHALAPPVARTYQSGSHKVAPRAAACSGPQSRNPGPARAAGSEGRRLRWRGARRRPPTRAARQPTPHQRRLHRLRVAGRRGSQRGERRSGARRKHLQSDGLLPRVHQCPTPQILRAHSTSNALARARAGSGRERRRRGGWGRR